MKKKRKKGMIGGSAASKVSWARDRWHDLGARPYPYARQDFERSLDEVIREFVVPGSAPPQPILSAEDSLVTLGSCFARELRDYLQDHGFASKSVWFPSGLNNTFAILDFISWGVTGEETSRGFRYDRAEHGAIVDWNSNDRERCINGLRRAGGFVFTLGLAEVWQDRESGSVFWKGVPAEIFDADRHQFRLSSVEENEANLTRIVELVRSVNPDAPIVFTLSPVPLAATFRPISCVVADCVSKSVLRVALDGVMARGLPGVYYWPSFEIVRWVGAHRSEPAYGKDDDKARHVNRATVAAIISAFVEAFYVPDAVDRMRSVPKTTAA